MTKNIIILIEVKPNLTMKRQAAPNHRKEKARQ
jgi:hypothetical protein